MTNSKLSKQQLIAGYQKKVNTLAITILIIVILVVGACVGRWKISVQNDEYKEYEELLVADIEEQKVRQEEILEEEAHTKTDQYVESVAKEKLGLVYPDEIIFKPEK